MTAEVVIDGVTYMETVKELGSEPDDDYGFGCGVGSGSGYGDGSGYEDGSGDGAGFSYIKLD